VRVLQVRRRRYLELTKLDCQVLLVALDSFAMDLRSDIAADSPFDAEYTFKHIANLREAVMILWLRAQGAIAHVERFNPLRRRQ